MQRTLVSIDCIREKSRNPTLSMGLESTLAFVCVAPIIVAKFITSHINCAIYRYNVWSFRTTLRHGEQQYVMEARVIYVIPLLLRWFALLNSKFNAKIINVDVKFNNAVERFMRRRNAIE